MFIKEVRIKNFRSIVKTEIQLSNISMFVGLNDVGKSNVLKALNLFFNNETDYGKTYSFLTDYSKFAPVRNKKAEEIIIEIILNAPNNYKDSKDIIWRKVWRKNGIHETSQKFIDGSEFPQKSKLYSWLQNIRYTYVPAIRDSNYFESLLAKLHDSLAETIEIELRTAGEDFISKIKSNTGLMISEIDKRLNIKSQIKLPSNLQTLFKAIDFSTEEGDFEVSISNRGDGIKTRYIPIILKFISEQLNINKIKGSANVNMIWGYEEPENNIEMFAAFKLAQDFLDYSKEIQILITTHSPGFYTLKDTNKERVSLFKVTKERNRDAEIKELNAYDDLDNDMGIMPLIAPYVKDKVSEINQLQDDIEKYKNELKNIDKHTIFVEGDDEIRIFSKILEHLGISNKIKISKDGLGCSGVKNQIMAWAWVAGVSNFKAVGVFDNDVPGNCEFKKLKNEKQFQEASSKKLVKAINYKVPSHLLNIKGKINNFPIELEEMYLVDAWKYAESRGWLIDRDMKEINSFFSLDNFTQSLDDKLILLGFNSDEILYIKKKVPDNHKDKLSKSLIQNKDSIEIKFEPIIKIFNELIIPFLK